MFGALAIPMHAPVYSQVILSFCLGANQEDASDVRCACYLAQGGQETDFILVSCSGAGVAIESKEKVLRAKQVNSTLINAVKDPTNVIIRNRYCNDFRQSCSRT